MYTQAIFSSQSPDYLIPFQPDTGDTVKVRLRTRKEDRIQCVLVIDDGQEEKKIPMTADLTLKTDQLFLWYAAEFRLGREPLHYYFEITANELRADGQGGTANDLRAHEQPAANDLRAHGRPGPETVLYYGRRGFFTKTEAREAADEQQTSSEVANEVANDLRGDERPQVQQTSSEVADDQQTSSEVADAEAANDPRGGEHPRPADLFEIIPGLQVPLWPAGCVMYQIFVDRFRNGDRSNDVLTDEYNYCGGNVVRIEDWNQLPAPNDVREFYGGDLQGVMDKLDYLRDLGVQAIYFNPLFVSPSNHKYDTQDYDHVDPHFGRIVRDAGPLLKEGDYRNIHAGRYITRTTDPANLEASDRLLAELIGQAHARGIRVILDGVFNHCGSFHKWMDKEHIYETAAAARKKKKKTKKGAYIAKKSPWHNYFDFLEEDWPDNWHYDGWWGIDTLPKLNYEASEELQEKILAIGKKWVSPPYNADGWRLDVAADLGHSPAFNHDFWQRFRQAVREANPQAVVLAENYCESEKWLRAGDWDTIMNYEGFMDPLTWFLTGMEKHNDQYREDLYNNADAFWEGMLYRNKEAMPLPSAYISMNQLSNHDHSRFLTRTGQKTGRLHDLGSEAASQGVRPAVMREAVIVQMTWPGAPTLYYGDEAGLCGFTDPDNRRPFPWGLEDRQMLAFHKDIIALHHHYPCLARGTVYPLAGEEGLIAYGRNILQDKNGLVIVLNNNERAKLVRLPVCSAGFPLTGKAEIIFCSDEKGYDPNPGRFVPILQGKVTLIMPARGAWILRAL